MTHGEPTCAKKSEVFKLLLVLSTYILLVTCINTQNVFYFYHFYLYSQPEGVKTAPGRKEMKGCFKWGQMAGRPGCFNRLHYKNKQNAFKLDTLDNLDTPLSVRVSLFCISC